MDGRRAQLVHSRPAVPVLRHSAPPEGNPGTGGPAAAGGLTTGAPAGHRRTSAGRPRTAWSPARLVRGSGVLGRGWAAAIWLGWPVLFFVLGPLIEPAPAEPEAAAPLAVELGSLAFVAAMTVAMVAAVTRHRMAAGATVVAGLVGLAFAVACPVSGHHSYGAWWVALMGLYAAMCALGLAALRSAPSTPTAEAPHG